MNMNDLLLRRRNAISIGHDRRFPLGNLDATIIAAFNLNLQSLGYTMSKDALTTIACLSLDDCVGLYREIVSTLKKIRGVTSYRPMYPNFPKQVFDATNAELYITAFAHYFSVAVADATGPDTIWLPQFVKDQREPLDENVELTVINLGTKLDLFSITVNLAQSNTSLSDTDKADLKWLIENGFFDVAGTIPNRETLAFIGATLLAAPATLREQYIPRLKSQIGTATDVLRLAVAMSGGDVSLAEVTKFRSFSRPERRLLLDLLEECSSSRTEDMNRWKMRWLRLGERLHPGEFKHKYHNAYRSFWTLRTDQPIDTFNSRIESSLRNMDIDTSVERLSHRPGEFARRLDHLLRMCRYKKDSALVLEKFRQVANNVSTPVLLQVMAHFAHRTSSDLRVIFPKGNVAKVQALEGTLPKIAPALCAHAEGIVRNALNFRFSQLPSLGKVFLDDALTGYLVPFSQRSASKSMRTLVRGSQIPLMTDKNTIRFFIHWHDGPSGRTDIDLSAMIYDANWKLMERIAYFNLQSSTYKAAHSGDITSAPNGACEFIDVDMPSVEQFGGRYVIMMVNSFTGQNFSDVSECKSGWMLRAEPQSGEIFDSRTVVDRIDITTAAKQAMPMIIDVVDRKIIWTDAAIRTNSGRVNNVAANSDSIALIGRAFTQIHKPTLYDLLALHALARCTDLVDTEEEADTVFSAETMPYELDRIASEFMANAAT